MIQPPHGIDEIRSVYGDIKVSDGRIVGPPGWESANMRVVINPGGWQGHKLYIHKLVVEPFELALSRALATGWVPTSIGCFNPRFKRGIDGELSGHSWGVCFDLDADANPLVVNCPVGDPRRVKQLPDAVVEAFKSICFAWGGDWAHRWDPQHCQFFDGY